MKENSFPSKIYKTHTRISNHPSHMRKGKRQNVIGNLIYIFFIRKKTKSWLL